MKNLEIFGDSILKGVIYQGDSGRYKLYSGSLENRLAERGITAHRFCRMGATVDAGLARLQNTLSTRKDMSGSTVLLEFGGNDCAYNWSEVSASPDAHHEPNTDLKRFYSVYETAIASARAVGADVALATLVPIDACKYMNFISRGLSYENILRWLGDVSMLYRWHEGYNRTVELLAEKYGCRLIDLRSGFLSAHNFSSLICDDGMHPTPDGHKMIEDALVRAV